MATAIAVALLLLCVPLVYVVATSENARARFQREVIECASCGNRITHRGLQEYRICPQCGSNLHFKTDFIEEP